MEKETIPLEENNKTEDKEKKEESKDKEKKEKNKKKETEEKEPKGRNLSPIPITLDNLLDANVRVLSGESIGDVAKDYNIPRKALKDRLDRINEFQGSKLPAIGLERQIISEALSERLKPIKEALSNKALEIVKKADDLTLEKLNDTPLVDLKLGELTRTADSYESRLARILGIEDYEDQGADISERRAQRISVKVQNLFAGHFDKLNVERETTDKNKEPKVVEGTLDKNY